MYCTKNNEIVPINSEISPKRQINPLPYDIFRGTQPMACGLFGPTEMTTLSVLKTILMM